MFLSDAHIHLNEEANGTYHDLNSLDLAISCTAKHSEWSIEPTRIKGRTIRSLGIHPWYYGEWNRSLSDELRCILSENEDIHVGEIGLDAKHGELSDQTTAFEEQMNLCSEFERIASVHMVGACEKPILDIIIRNPNCRRIILHSFKGPESYIKPFSRNGCMFSISPRIMSLSEERRKRLLSAIPIDNILLETDYPNAGRGFESMEKHMNDIAKILDYDTESLSSLIHDNFTRMLE